MVIKVLQCLKLKMTSSQNVLKRTGPKRTKEQMGPKRTDPNGAERKKKV